MHLQTNPNVMSAFVFSPWRPCPSSAGLAKADRYWYFPSGHEDQRKPAACRPFRFAHMHNLGAICARFWLILAMSTFENQPRKQHTGLPDACTSPTAWVIPNVTAPPKRMTLFWTQPKQTIFAGPPSPAQTCLVEDSTGLDTMGGTCGCFSFLVEEPVFFHRHNAVKMVKLVKIRVEWHNEMLQVQSGSIWKRRWSVTRLILVWSLDPRDLFFLEMATDATGFFPWNSSLMICPGSQLDTTSHEPHEAIGSWSKSPVGSTNLKIDRAFTYTAISKR